MKRAIKVLMVVVLVAVTVSSVYAIGPFGPGIGGPGSAVNYGNLTPEQKAKIEKFTADAEVQGLREQIIKKRAELTILRTQSNPDWKAIEQKRKEIVELTTQIQKKAHEEGVTGQFGYGYGAGRMMGGMMGSPFRGF
ncbi:MAG: periplasmic heavy metal sensor [Nitrospirae bacterium]|nr:periplasmic heavy metal sensor [Nitrospirota bacterium]